MSVNVALPSITAEGGASAQAGRTDQYLDSIVVSALNRDVWSATEGSRYVAVNPTPGTGILGHAAPTTFDETKPYLLIYNGGSKTICPVTIRLTDTVVSVGGTRIQFTQVLDQGNRYSSGGTALVSANTNMGSSNGAGATITAGAVLATAASSNRRLLGNSLVKGANIDVVWDQIELVFGTTGGSTGGMLTPTTVAQWYSVPCAPVAIPPGYMWALYQWAASQSTGPTYEVVVDYIAR